MSIKLIKLFIVIISIGGCSLKVSPSLENVIFPDGAKNIYVGRIINLTYQPVINNTIEIELKYILKKNKLLSEVKYLSDLLIESSLVEAKLVTGSYSSIDSDYYSHNYSLKVEYRLIDLIKNNKVIQQNSVEALHKYNSDYKNPEYREIVNGYNTTAKIIAEKIVNEINYNF